MVNEICFLLDNPGIGGEDVFFYLMVMRISVMIVDLVIGMMTCWLIKNN